MIVEEQRKIAAGGRGEVPCRAIEKLVVLGYYAGRRVVGDIHEIGCPAPRRCFIFAEAQAIGHEAEGAGMLRLEPIDDIGRLPQIALRHQVRVSVVVHEGAVLVRSGHAGYAESVAPARVEKPKPHPETGRLHESSARFEETLSSPRRWRGVEV